MSNVDFWRDASADIFWFKEPTRILDDSRAPFNRWFPDGVTNACYNALDVHVTNGNGGRLAIIYDSPVTQTQLVITYSELLDQVARFGGLLRYEGVKCGDRVIIYMPMVPETIIAMLACARIGAVHSVVFGGFASQELVKRIDDTRPILVVSASCGIEKSGFIAYKPLLDAAIELASYKPKKCIILQRPELTASLVRGRDIDWQQGVRTAVRAECIPLSANHPLYILYTSGTTGEPKGVVRDTGGSIVSLKWSMKNIYNVHPGDVYWAASDLGWVVGHSYITYGPLFNGNTTVLYEGKPVGTPDAGAFWRVISQYKVKVLFTAPTTLRVIIKEDPDGKLLKLYDTSSLSGLFLAGERCDSGTMDWAIKRLNIPVIDHWWQTETGWPICSYCLGMRDNTIVLGSSGRPVRGYNVGVMNNQGAQAKPGETGALVIKMPLPPGTFTTLWNADERYQESYFTRYPGYYDSGDSGYVDEGGYVFVMSRTDDVINISGHRISTGAIEEVLGLHADISECAVFGVDDEIKGQIPVGLIVLSDSASKPEDEVIYDAILSIREKMGAFIGFRVCKVVSRLPKTRSGKILRGAMRQVVNGHQCVIPATIEDPHVFEEIKAILGEIAMLQHKTVRRP